MTVLFEVNKAGKHYEVRQAGASLRLYTNGAFHSQWNKSHVFGGAVWDLLSLPVLLRATPTDHILMLGVGGGASLNQLRFLLPNVELTGVDIDATHLGIAKDYFGVNHPRTRLVHRDALAFVDHNQERFNVVIDDLYSDAPGDPVHPAKNESVWTERTLSLLLPDGLLIKNHLDAPSARRWLNLHRPLIKRTFANGLNFSASGYSNVVTALFSNHSSKNNASLSLIKTALDDYGLSSRGRRSLSRIQVRRVRL